MKNKYNIFFNTVTKKFEFAPIANGHPVGYVLIVGGINGVNVAASAINIMNGQLELAKMGHV